VRGISGNKSEPKLQGLDEKKIGMTGETIHQGEKKGERGLGRVLFGLGKMKDVGEVEVEPDRYRKITSL
jgi:hypothetical protein